MIDNEAISNYLAKNYRDIYFMYTIEKKVISISYTYMLEWKS